VIPRASNTLAAKRAGGDGKADAGGTVGFDDAALVQKARRGDMEAFAALVAKYQDRVFNVVFRMCSRREDAEELAQETFLRALERISQFRGQSRFYTWLFRIAANMVISHRRRSGRIKFQSLSGLEELPPTQAAALTRAAGKPGPSPQAAVVAAETKRRIEDALGQLDDQMRLVVVLRDVEDMEYSQMADVLNVPVGTVKSRLHRARCALKEKLADLLE